MRESLSHNIGNETTDQPNVNDWSIVSELAKNPDYDNQSFGAYTPENTRKYIADRFSKNVSVLEKNLQDEHTLELYKNIMSEFPVLRMVSLVDEDTGYNAHFSLANFENGSYFPEVVCNLSHPESYILELDKSLEIETQEDRLGTAYFIKRLAFAVGADWKSCAKDIRLNADATLLHELGHAHDFIENYLRPEYERIDGSSRGAEALYYSVLKSNANRAEFRKRGPNPEGKHIGRSSEGWRQYERRLKAMGIDNYDEYLYATHQYYRDMPDEKYADQFAYDYIIKHYDDYFTTNENERGERIFVDETKEIELDPDFVHILGIKQGLGVEIDRLDENKKPIKHVKGFLAMNMYLGKSVYLYENGDPKKPGEKWRIAKGISGMTLKPIRNRNTGSIEHYLLFKDEEGAEYHISRSGEEPEMVSCSPNEMAEELGLAVGDKVQLIEHLEGDARAIDSNKLKDVSRRVMEGKVSRIDGDDENEKVEIIIQDGKNNIGLSHSPKRKWKTWFIGNYEILPLPEYLKS